jgi:hypothetical protein
MLTFVLTAAGRRAGVAAARSGREGMAVADIVLRRLITTDGPGPARVVGREDTAHGPGPATGDGSRSVASLLRRIVPRPDEPASALGGLGRASKAETDRIAGVFSAGGVVRLASDVVREAGGVEVSGLESSGSLPGNTVPAPPRPRRPPSAEDVAGAAASWSLELAAEDGAARLAFSRGPLRDGTTAGRGRRELMREQQEEQRRDAATGGVPSGGAAPRRSLHAFASTRAPRAKRIRGQTYFSTAHAPVPCACVRGACVHATVTKKSVPKLAAPPCRKSRHVHIFFIDKSLFSAPPG